MSKFDLQAARKAGYDDKTILEGLAKERPDFDLEAARAAGYDDATILDGLAGYDYRATTWEKVSGAVGDAVKALSPEKSPDAPSSQAGLAAQQKPAAAAGLGFRGKGASGSWGEAPKQPAAPLLDGFQSPTTQSAQNALDLAQSPEEKAAQAAAAVHVPAISKDKPFKPASMELRAGQDAAAVAEYRRARGEELRRQMPQAKDDAINLMLDREIQTGQSAVQGTISESDFDFDTHAQYKDAGSLERGAAKGVNTLHKQALGLHQFIGDALGADGYSAAMADKREVLDRESAGIGERDQYLTRNWEGAIASIVSQTPGLTVSVLSGGSIPLLMMGAQVFGEEYATGKQAGLTGGEATARAAVHGVAEIVGEKIGMPSFLKVFKDISKGVPTDQLLGTLAAHIAREVPGEQITTAIQFANDKFAPYGLNQEAGLKEYLTQAADTLTQTIMQAGAMGATGAAVNLPAAKQLQSEQVAADVAKENALSKWRNTFSAPKGGLTRAATTAAKTGMVQQAAAERAAIEATELLDEGVKDGGQATDAHVAAPGAVVQGGQPAGGAGNSVLQQPGLAGAGGTAGSPVGSTGQAGAAGRTVQPDQALTGETNATQPEQVAAQAGKAAGTEVQAANQAPEQGSTGGLSIGTTPKDVEPITVRDGVIYQGEYPAAHFETGDVIKVPEGASNEVVAQALRDAGVLSGKQKIYGLNPARRDYKAMLAALKAGKTEIDGVKDMATAQNALKAGAIKSPGDLRRFEENGYPKKFQAANPVADNAPPAARAAASKKPLSPPATSEEVASRARKGFIKAIKDMGGISTAEARDITGEKNANKLMPGMFRKTGNALDLVARRLNELGYLSDEDYNDVDGGVQKVRDLVRQVLDGEPVMTPADEELYAELSAREDELASAVSAPAEEMAEDVADEFSDELTELPDFGSPSTTSDADMMRSLGFTEDEINAELQKAAQAGASAQADAVQTDRAPQDSGTRADQGQEEDFGLQAQTESDLKAADERAKQAADAKTKADAAADARAQADAERDGFTLTGSDRPADANPGQGDLLGANAVLDSGSLFSGAETKSAPPEKLADRVRPDAKDGGDVGATLKRMNVVRSLPGEANTEIHVIRNVSPATGETTGYSVGMFDMDSGQYMPVLRQYKGDDALQKATDYAESIAPPVDMGADQAKNESQGGTNDDAGTVQTEGVPAGREDGDQGQRQDGDRDSEPLDAGLAADSEGTAGGRRVPGRVSGSGRAGTQRGSVDGRSDVPDAAGNGGVRRPADGAAGAGLDYEITDSDGIGKGGLGAKYRDNIAAIKIIKALEAESRIATPEERKALVRYVGWGALKGVFDPANKQWAKQHKELRDLLSDVEWESARASVLNAHYTSPAVVKAIYEAVDKLGFKGGRILEPSMGSGNFFGLMPKDLRANSKLHGVELDNLTSRLARALYPNAVIATSTGFQEYQVPAGYFDMAIGNPPFGSEPIVDRERSEYSGWSIHNYFIARMIDKTRDGGIVPVIVSHSFMDAMNSRTREWVAKRANMLGAVRLPDTAFQENAGTEVVTDILFFQKTANPEQDPAWVNTSDIDLTNEKTGENAKVAVNDYFLANPRNVLGRQTLGGTMYRANSYTVEKTGDIEDQLTGFINDLPANVYQPIERPSEELAQADETIPDGIKPGSYYVDASGVIRQRGNDVAGLRTSRVWDVPTRMVKGVPTEVSTAVPRMRAMIQLRDLLRAQMRMELSDNTPQDTIESARRVLNERYDAFLKEFGYLNGQINRRMFMDDTESALLQALEFDYDPGISKKKAEETGLEPKPESATKADILTRRVLFPPKDEINVTNAKDALLASLNAKGKVDPSYMSAAYGGKTWGDIERELGDLIFNDPQAGYVTADEYLSGDVKTKLAEAKAAAGENPSFGRNVLALEKVIPADKLPSEIFASMGANWIPTDVYQAFAKEITGSDSVRVNYLGATAQWLTGMEGGGDAGKMTSEYGTDKISAYEIFALMLNGRAPEVKKRISDPSASGGYRYVTDEEATEAARSRMDKIKQAWESWVWSDGERAERLSGIYNDKHNRTVGRGYDGSHLTLPGSTPALTMRAHQKNVIWRGVQERNVLMDHVVGAGKTFAMIGTIMEMKRLGIARKPLFVVPNHLTLQWRSDFSRLYPASNVLAATPEDFSKDNRERMFAKIATGDYDAVVIGHSSLTKIGLDPAIEAAMNKEQLDAIANEIEEMKRDRGDKGIIRDMEKIKANLEAKIAKLVQNAGDRDQVVTFNELGVDALFIDEMHEFKNLFFYTQKQRVSGLGNPAGSGKAFDLFMKIRWMQEALGEKAPLITATGTPVSNSLAEMFTMQRFMRYGELKREGLHLFDAWSRMYGEDEYVYEVAPSGVGYRISQRFSKFKNLPSLMGHYKSFADVVTLQDLKDQSKAEGKRFPVPKIKGGRQQNIVAPRSTLQRDFFGVPEVMRDDDGKVIFEINHPENATIEEKPDAKEERLRWVLKHDQGVEYHATREEAELALAEKAMTPKMHLDPKSIVGQFNNLKELTRATKGKINALSLTGLANKAGLDYRLINPAAPDFEGSKINKAVDNMVEIYRQWTADKGTQLVFCDLSVPLSAKAAAASKEKRLYVVDDAGVLIHKKGTLHTIEGRDGFPFYLVKHGKGDKASVSLYEPVSGVMLRGGFKDKGEAKAWAEQTLDTDTGRDRWYEIRDSREAITPERIAEYRDANELEIDEDGSNEIGMDDLEAIIGAGGFSVYDDIKAKLIARGIPEHEIAFIHDYHTPKQKAELFKRVNRGDVRFLFGSTPKLGAGTNVQERLVGLHHIDAPWRPSDLEQREGRIIRQGNKLYERDPDGFEVFICRYATEQTYDTRRWQLLEHKASGIEQLRKYSGEAEIEDVAGEAANAADMKAAASGNPLILEETKLRNDVKRLTALRRAHEDGKFAMHNKIKHLRNTIGTFIPERLAAIEEARQAVAKHPAPTEKGAIPSIVIEGKKAKDREEAEKLIGELVTRARAGGMFSTGNQVVEYRGVPFKFEKNRLGSLEVLHNYGTLVGYASDEIVSNSGLITRMGNFIERLETDKQYYENLLEQNQKDLASLEANVGKPFDGTQELADTVARHAVIQRKLMKSTQMDAVPPEQRAEFEEELKARREALEKLGYGKAVKEATQDDAPMYSMAGDKAMLPGKVGAVEREAASLTAKWANAPEIVVAESLNDARVPQRVRDHNAKMIEKRGAQGEPEAFFYGGRVYLIASQLNGKADVARAVFHEALGHAGLRGTFGDDLSPILRQIVALRRAEVAAKAKEYGLDMANEADRLVAAEEVLAEMAQTRPEIGFVKRAIAAIRNWLRRHGLDLELTDNDIIQAYILPARAFVERGGKPAGEAGAMPAFMRGDSLAAKVWRLLAGDPIVFQHPMPDSFDMGEAAQEINRKMFAREDALDIEDEKHLARKWHVTMPDGTHAYVMENHQNEVWIDASRLAEGASGGTRLYLLVGSYASDNGKVFIGDPAGLSDVALLRRTENMLSLALRFGKTDFLRPHRFQEFPAEKHDTVLDGIVRPINWVEGDDLNNIEELMRTSYANAIRLFPEIKDVTYNFDRQRFERDGKEFTDFNGIVKRGIGILRQRGLAKILSARKPGTAGSEAQDFAPVGSATLKRAAILNTVAREARGGRGGELLAAISRVVSGGLKDTPLAGILYSRQKPLPGTTQQQPPQLSKQPPLGLSGGFGGNQADWSMPIDTAFERFVYKWQDKHIDTKRAVQAITEAAGFLADKWNPYLQEELFHGRTAKRTLDFVERELNPLLKDAAARGLTLDEIDQFLHARHAEEANKLIAERDPNMKDGGSGMKTSEARAYFRGLDAGKRTDLEAVAARVDAIIAKTRQLYADYGLVDQDTVTGWGKMFKHYVPLMREDKDGAMGIGQGFSIKGKEVKHRTGSTRAVVDILANIAMQRERAIVRGEKNRVAVALAGLAKLNPNPDFWTFDSVPTERVLNEETGLVETRSDPQFRSRPNVVIAKIKGRGGKVEERAIVFNEQDERAARMVQALKNLDIVRLEGVMGVSAAITRYFASINTQYNPVFGFVNLTRDAQAAALNLSSTPIKGQRAKVLRYAASALSGIYRDTRAERKGSMAASSWAAEWEEYTREGGQTGYRDMYANSNDRARAIERALNPAAWMDTKLGRIFTVGGALKVPLSVAQKGAGWIFDWLSDFNLTMENAVRVAAYKVAKEQGMSRQQAASLAKNLTVNFNRRGQAGQQAGALYAFFNASMQGTARMAETLVKMEPGQINTARLSGAGKAIVGGGVLLGMMQAVLLAAMGFDDDEPPEFVRERNLILPLTPFTGKKNYISIPMPLGFHVFPNLGRHLVEAGMDGEYSDHALTMLGIMAEAFNPMGSSGLSLQTVMPTAADPLVALAENKDWTGKPIYLEDFGNELQPGFERAKNTASSTAKALAEAIHYATGGTEYTAGRLSPTPDQIDYLIEQITGGVGREFGKGEQTVSALFSGEELPPHKIPLAGRYYGNSEGQSSQADRFYKNLDRANRHEKEIKGRRRDGESTADYFEANPDADIWMAGNRAEKRVKSLRKRKLRLIEQNAPRDDIKAIDAEITEVMRDFNELAKESRN